MKIDRFAGFPFPPEPGRYHQMSQFLDQNRDLDEKDFLEKAAQELSTTDEEWGNFWKLQDLDPKYNPEQRFIVRRRYPLLWFLLLLNVVLGILQLAMGPLLSTITGAANFMAAGFVAGVISTLIVKERL